jgi:hypothetical protein
MECQWPLALTGSMILLPEYWFNNNSSNRYVGYEDDDDDSELGHAYRSKYSHK